MDAVEALQGVADRLPDGSGPLGLLSSDEFLPPAGAFDRRLLELSGTRVGVIYCADHRAQSHSERFARRHFDALGARAITLDMHADVLSEFDLAYIAGGSPKDLLEHLRASPLWERIMQRWRDGAALAGSSAGAMVLCAHTLVPEPSARVPTTWTTGAGLVDGVALAVHASSRPRAWLEDVARDAPQTLLAMPDKTGVILRRGETPEIFGEAPLLYPRGA
ncbi:MAG: Type 1 glutamine amidotransferase-like domain-containing protein [Actinomycetota bacterium]